MGGISNRFGIFRDLFEMPDGMKKEENMKKILFVIYSMKYGGAERSLVNLLQELPRDKYEVDLLLFQKTGDFLQQIPEWVNVMDTPKILNGLYAPLGKGGLWGFVKVAGTGCARLARKTIKTRSAFRWRHFYSKCIRKLPKHYDVAAAYAGTENLYFIRDFVDANRKLVWIHNDYRTAGYSKADDYDAFAQMDGIVSISEECVQVLREEFPEYAHKLHCIENITSSAVVRRLAQADAPEYGEDVANILSVGRLHPQKGFDMAVKAAAILKREGVRFCWYIIGEGPLRGQIEQQIKEEGVEDCFILLGTRNNPYPYIKNSMIMIQPSRYEGKSVVLDEAKILGTPIVATAYPTVRDQISEGREGVITPMDPEGIAQGIKRMIEDAQLRDQIRTYLTSHEYGNQAEVEKYMALLDAKEAAAV